jgi:two-component system LytT family response regulator
VIRVLIVDDEAPARRRLRELLSSEPDFEVMGEAVDGVEAVDSIRAAAPDLVFLDIQMPWLDGFGVIAEIGIGNMPRVVFVTAYDEFALKAFEVEALDYLLKPFPRSRFQRLLERVRRQDSGNLSEKLDRLLAAASARPEFPRQILVERGEGRQALLDVMEIEVIRADANYLTFLSRGGGEYRLRGTLREIEGRLDPELFVRINRSEIIRVGAIRELNPWFHGDIRVILWDGTALTLSRRYRSKIEWLS